MHGSKEFSNIQHFDFLAVCGNFYMHEVHLAKIDLKSLSLCLEKARLVANTNPLQTKPLMCSSDFFHSFILLLW